MKISIVSISFLSLFFFFLSVSHPVVLSDYKKAQEDYSTSFEEYRNVYQEYKKSKNFYLTYKTLNAQTEALTKTKLLLEARDDVLISYFTFLKEKLAATDGITPFEKNTKLGIINSRIVFIEEHKATIPPVASLDDVVTKSHEIDNVKQTINTEAEQIVGSILVGKLKNESEKLATAISRLSQIVNQIKDTGVDVTKLERWLLETNTKHDLAKRKVDEANNLFENLSDKEERGRKENFSLAKKLILEGHQYLKETNFNAQETIKDLTQGPY